MKNIIYFDFRSKAVRDQEHKQILADLSKQSREAYLFEEKMHKEALLANFIVSLVVVLLGSWALFHENIGAICIGVIIGLALSNMLGAIKRFKHFRRKTLAKIKAMKDIASGKGEYETILMADGTEKHFVFLNSSDF